MRLNDTLRPHKVNLKFMRSPDTCRSDIHARISLEVMLYLRPWSTKNSSQSVLDKGIHPVKHGRSTDPVPRNVRP